ncbi:MAG: cation:proton antiporter [Coraliomargarita sp.]
MDALLLAIAFVFGLLAQQLKLPPLVGFLVSGFVLQAMGKQGGPILESMANIGVTLMLFSIGLKLRLRSLTRPEVWAGTSIHVLLVLLVFTPLIVLLGAVAGQAMGLDWQTALLVAFALSFSSTVFAVKSLNESGDMGAMYGRIAIGVLIMQDILAVLFLTFSTGKIPTLWALPLLGCLLFGRKWIRGLVGRSGHGEMIALCGLFLALFVGAEGFTAVGLKADLGALFIGVLVGSHPKSKELSKSLSGVTDLLLIGFFLQIGLQGAVSVQAVLWALLFIALLPLKNIGFFFLFTRFHLRGRTSWMSGLTLSTYSEFGLIVLALAVSKGWLGSDWLVAMALALSASILIVAPLQRNGEQIYEPRRKFLKRFETKGTHPDDLPIDIGEHRIAIFGMGRVGVEAYRYLSIRYPGKVIGFDRDPEAVELHCNQGRNVLLADATDSDFWRRMSAKDSIDLAVLAMPKHAANIHAAQSLKSCDFHGVVASTGKFDDEVKELRELGLDTAFNLYAEAGSGFAGHIYHVFNQQRPDLAYAWQAKQD